MPENTKPKDETPKEPAAPSKEQTPPKDEAPKEPTAPPVPTSTPANVQVSSVEPEPVNPVLVATAPPAVQAELGEVDAAKVSQKDIWVVAPGAGMVGDFTEGQEIDWNRLWLGSSDQEKVAHLQRLLDMGVLVRKSDIERPDFKTLRFGDLRSGTPTVLAGEVLAANDPRLATGGPHRLLIEQENVDARERIAGQR